MIGVLIFPDFQLLDAAGPIAAFEIAARFASNAPDIRTLALKAGPVRSSSGVEMLARGLKPATAITTLIIAGGNGVRAPATCPTTLAFVQRLAGRGVRVASVCSGAYVLAEAGLLDGRRATTHWRSAARFAAAFSEVQVDPDVLFVDHGDVATSAGTGAGIDLCLHLVRSDHGAAYAAQIARRMVLPPHREGSQLQYAAQPAPARADESLAPLLEWATSHLDTRLTLDHLAERAGLSSRALARRFTEQLGTSPGQWLLGQRLDAARILLEQTDLPVEAIATRVGLASAINLRRRFRVHLGTTPRAYRRTFSET